MRVLRWSRKHFILLTVGVAVLTPAVLGLHWWYWPSVPTTSADEVEAIEVHLRRYEHPSDPDRRQEEGHIRSTVPEQIQALLNVFKAAERASDHKCGNSGTITICKKDGSKQELAILPGHDSVHYEYRYGGRINRIDREQFVIALKGIGVQQIKLSPP